MGAAGRPAGTMASVRFFDPGTRFALELAQRQYPLIRILNGIQPYTIEMPQHTELAWLRAPSGLEIARLWTLRHGAVTELNPATTVTFEGWGSASLWEMLPFLERNRGVRLPFGDFIET